MASCWTANRVALLCSRHPSHQTLEQKMSDKKCPNCGLWNPPSAMRCDCGYDFNSLSVKPSYADQTTFSFAQERAENNLPTLVVRGIVFITVYLIIALAMYFVTGNKPGGIMLGIAFGLAGAAAAIVKIKVKNWF